MDKKIRQEIDEINLKIANKTVKRGNWLFWLGLIGFIIATVLIIYLWCTNFPVPQNSARKNYASVEQALYNKYHQTFKVTSESEVYDSDSDNILDGCKKYVAYPESNKDLVVSVVVYKNNNNEFVDDYKLSKKLYSIKKIKDNLVHKYSSSVEKYVTSNFKRLNVPCYIRVLPSFDVKYKYIDRKTLKEVKGFKDSKYGEIDTDDWYGIARKSLKSDDVIKVLNYTAKMKPDYFNLYIEFYDKNKTITNEKLYNEIQNIVSDKYTLKTSINHNQSEFAGNNLYPFEMCGAIYSDINNYNEEVDGIKRIPRDNNCNLYRFKAIAGDLYKQNQPDSSFSIEANSKGKLSKNKNELLQTHYYIK